MKSYDEENILKKFYIAVTVMVHRNDIICHDYTRRAKKNRINLNYYRIDNKNQEDNLGDYLSKIVYEKMLDYYGLDKNYDSRTTKHLYAIGSILFTGFQDCTVWGTGLIREYNQTIAEKITLFYNKFFRKLDIRCVRGPKTREVLLKNGIECPENYGDPALLMPLFYEPKEMKKKDYLIIVHYTMDISESDNVINMKTRDYEYIIDQICSAELVISSSLHGMILAEAYGVPAIILDDGEEFTRFKYDDYYLSTGRNSYPIVKSIEEALKTTPPPIPDFNSQQKMLIKLFPKDLWNVNLEDA